MEILFCERCGERVRTAEVRSGRCRREEGRIWCPDCSEAIAATPPGSVRAQVIAEPPADRRPSGAEPVPGMAPPPMRKRGK